MSNALSFLASKVGSSGDKQSGSMSAPAQEQPQHQQQGVASKALSFLTSKVGSGGGDKDASTAPSTQAAAAQAQQQQQGESSEPAAAPPAPSDYTALLFVSLLWGSYAPALRYLYSMDDLLTPQVRLLVCWLLYHSLAGL